MKRQITITLVSLLVVIGITAVASAQGRSVVVKVPFAFVAGNTTLPAGEYVITRATRNSEKMLLIRSVNGRASAVIQTNAVERRAVSDSAELHFARYDDRYFLAQVWTPGSSAGRELPRSRREKEIEEKMVASRSGDGVATHRGTTVKIYGL
jgi:hypothetical protein